MELFNRIFQTAQDAPELPAFQNLCSGETLGYGELMERSGRGKVKALVPTEKGMALAKVIPSAVKSVSLPVAFSNRRIIRALPA